MPEVRDELAKLAAGRDGDTTTVLLARTDLGSAAPGRTRTTSFPAGAAAAAETPAPVAAPPPFRRPRRRPPRHRVRPAPRERGRRRGRALWVAAALVALVLAGLIVFWALDPFADDGSNAQGLDGRHRPRRAAEPTAGETEPSATESSSSASETAAADAQDPAAAVSDFFALIPGDLTAAHQLTSPAFQSEFPLERFSGFWDDFSNVQISNVESEDDTTALVDITYERPDGSSRPSATAITFVEGEDGQLLLDSDAIA